MSPSQPCPHKSTRRQASSDGGEYIICNNPECRQILRRFDPKRPKPDLTKRKK